MDRPRETIVTLSTGQPVTLGVMTWAGYVRLKNRVVSILSGSVGNLLGDVTAGGDPLGYLPRLLVAANEALTESTPELIGACVRSPLETKVEDLSAHDILALRDGCGLVNDLEDLIEREKNSLQAMFGKTISLLTGSNRTSPAPSGGPTGNPS